MQRVSSVSNKALNHGKVFRMEDLAALFVFVLIAYRESAKMTDITVTYNMQIRHITVTVMAM